jgi:hypothetical protein
LDSEWKRAIQFLYPHGDPLPSGLEAVDGAGAVQVGEAAISYML